MAGKQNTSFECREPVIEVVSWEMAEILRKKTEAERLAIAWGMWEAMRDMLLNLLKSEHPDWSDSQIKQEVARRLARETERATSLSGSNA